jgi:sugar-phosphatase
MSSPNLPIVVRAVLFDMDGTLVDSTGVVEQVWGVFAADYGLDIDAILATSHGVQGIDTVRRFAPADADHRAIAADLMARELVSTEGIVEIPGALAFVDSLPADAVALVTSATVSLAELRMNLAGIAMPTVAVTAETVTRGKPDPEGFALAASRLGVDPSETVVFEDAEAGIAGALAAGCRVVVVGALESTITSGLPRIRDYTAVSASVGVSATGERVISISV